MRQVKGGNSAHSQDSGVSYFGLGSANVLTSVQILWPSGATDVMANVTVNRVITIVEGSTGTSVALEAAGASRGALAQNAPNPFARETEIRVRLTIYDLSGARIRTIADGPHEAGELRATWDGHDDAGRRVPAGAYVYTLRAAGVSESRTLILLR
jgi:hypothetical protein